MNVSIARPEKSVVATVRPVPTIVQQARTVGAEIPRIIPNHVIRDTAVPLGPKRNSPVHTGHTRTKTDKVSASRVQQGGIAK